MNRTNISMTWLATLNFSKGVPYVIVMVISLLMLRQMGLRPAVITLLVGLCYLPWVLKVWWKPFIERLLRGSLWVLITQMLLSVSFAAMAFAFPSEGLVVGLLMLIAWLTAIHNVAVDRLSAKAEDTAHHRMTRELSRKFAVVIGQGVLVMLAGNLQVFYRHDMLYAWRLMFYFVAGLFLLLFFWHLVVLTVCREYGEPAAAHARMSGEPIANTRAGVDMLPEGTGVLVAFFLLYPFAQAMIGKVSILFLTDTSRHGGLGLSPQEFGLVMGTVGIIALTVGGLLGRKFLHLAGFASCKWFMALSMLVPGMVYASIGYSQPASLMIISACVLTEQLAYGFGFALYLWLLQQISWREKGKSMMALSLLAGCALSGLLQEAQGYSLFFLTALALSGISLVAVAMLRKIPIHK
jgi:PAT family beta-lactamase induction signal transducer AmpG